MKREKLIKRVKSLWTLELFNVFFLPFAFILKCLLNGQPIGFNSTSAMVLNGILLLQGSYFWFRYKQLIEKRVTVEVFGIFRVFGSLNLFLIVLSLVLLLLFPFQGSYDRIGAWAFFALAVLEYINYFEIQLMYDNKNDLSYVRRYRRLKTAKLRRILMG